MYKEARDENMRHDMREHIKSDAVNKQVNPEKQSKHDKSCKGYIEGRSYLLPGVDAQELVDRYHGTGRPEMSKNGEWKNKENVVADKIVGVRVDPNTGQEVVTNKVTIHYSKTGTHIVPAKPWKD